VDVGKQVELGAVEEIGIKPPSFNGQSGERCRRVESFRLEGAGLDDRIEGDIDHSERRTGAAGNRRLDNAERSEAGRAVSELCSIDDLAPTGSTGELEGDQCSDLLDDLSERTRAIDVLENVAAPALTVSQRGVLEAHLTFHDPAPGTGRKQQYEQQADEGD